ncbi:NUDIX hydrolase [Streptomyces collinus]
MLKLLRDEAVVLRSWGWTVLTQTMPSDTVRAMVNGDGVPEKVAWVLVRDDRVLVTRSHGRDRFYFPGGHRELGESGAETLVREIDEELQATIDPGSMVHFGTFEIGEGHPDHGPFMDDLLYRRSPR